MRKPWLGFSTGQISVIRYAASAGVVVSLLATLLSQSRRGHEMSLTELTRLKGIRVSVVADGGAATIGMSTITVNMPPANHLRSFWPLLSGELAVYPTEAFEKFGLREVIVCDRLLFNGRTRMATLDVDRGRLYLVALGGWDDREYAKHAIHHELFHMIDFRVRGGWSTDPSWEALNIPGFRYGRGGETMQDDPSASLPDLSVAGFLNPYSRSGVAEDKAEIFAHLMTKPRVLDARAAGDKIISAKKRQMVALLERLCPMMGPDFWKVVHARN